MLIIDPRVDRTRLHNLGDILVVAVCCMLCGGESFYDMEDFGLAKEAWLRTFPELPNGIPSHDTFNRVFAALDPAKFNACFLKWTEGLRKTVAGDIVSLDGKALRRAAGGAGIPFIVNAWSSSNGLVLGQVKVVDKSNEIAPSPNCSTRCCSRAASSPSTPWAARERRPPRSSGPGPTTSSR